MGGVDGGGRGGGRMGVLGWDGEGYGEGGLAGRGWVVGEAWMGREVEPRRYKL